MTSQIFNDKNVYNSAKDKGARKAAGGAEIYNTNRNMVKNIPEAAQH